MFSLLLAAAMCDVKIEVTRTYERPCYTCVRHLLIERNACGRTYLRTHEHVQRGVRQPPIDLPPNVPAPAPMP